MKKFLSIYLIIAMLFISTAYATAPSSDVTSLYKIIPNIRFEIYKDLTKTVYPIIMLYCKDFLNAGLGSNVHIDDALILYLNNQHYQLVTFYFPTLYTNCKVMGIFFGSNIWIRSGILTEDGGIIFDMTEINDKEIEMFLFSNL